MNQPEQTPEPTAGQPEAVDTAGQPDPVEPDPEAADRGGHPVQPAEGPDDPDYVGGEPTG